MILAASRGLLDICRLLLEEGADPFLKDNCGNDAIATAAARGQTEVAQFLQGFGRDAGRDAASNPGGNRSRTAGPDECSHHYCCPGAVSDDCGADPGPERAGYSAGLGNAFHGSCSDEDDACDLSLWQEEIEVTSLVMV